MSRVVWAASLVITFALIVLVVHLSTTGLEFSRWNTDWNGTSDFFTLLEGQGVVEVFDYRSLPEKPGNVLFIVSVRDAFREEEMSRLKAFLDAGNRIVIIDEGSGGADLAGKLGGPLEISKSTLAGIDRPYGNRELLLAYPDKNTSVTEGVDSILLDLPHGVSGGTPLFSTGLFSWQDPNGNGKFDGGEEMGRIPVLVRAETGNGDLFVLSDASTIINGVMRTPAGAGNRQLIRNLARVTGHVYLDEVHGMTGDSVPLTRFFQIIRNSILLKALLLFIVAGVVFLCIRKRSGEENHG
jgi:hypothetical protein